MGQPLVLDCKSLCGPPLGGVCPGWGRSFVLSSHIQILSSPVFIFVALSDRPSRSLGSGSRVAFADCLCDVSPGVSTPSPGAWMVCVAWGAIGTRGAA